MPTRMKSQALVHSRTIREVEIAFSKLKLQNDRRLSRELSTIEKRVSHRFLFWRLFWRLICRGVCLFCNTMRIDPTNTLSAWDADSDVYVDGD